MSASPPPARARFSGGIFQERIKQGKVKIVDGEKHLVQEDHFVSAGGRHRRDVPVFVEEVRGRQFRPPLSARPPGDGGKGVEQGVHIGTQAGQGFLRFHSGPFVDGKVVVLGGNADVLCYEPGSKGGYGPQ
jgi:hypothetical protein